METSEIRELLEQMHALVEEDGAQSVDSVALMQDPILANRLAVELLQNIDQNKKPELVLSGAGVNSYFGYSVALTGWMRFGFCDEDEQGTLSIHPGVAFKKKQKALVVLDAFDEAKAQAYVDLCKKEGLNLIAILCVVGAKDASLEVPCFSLL